VYRTFLCCYPSWSLHLVNFLRIGSWSRSIMETQIFFFLWWSIGLKFFSLVYVTFFSSRCIFELKFAIYHRASSPFSQGFLSKCMQYWLKNQWVGICSNTISTMNEKASLCLNASWPYFLFGEMSNNYVSLLSILCACVEVKKMASQMKS